MMGVNFIRKHYFLLAPITVTFSFQFLSCYTYATNQNYCQPVKNALLCQKLGLGLMPSQGVLQKSLLLNMK